MKLYFVRHGETAYNTEGRFQGHIDIPLDEKGKEQAEKLADRFQNGEKIDAIYCSPLSRALDTARVVGSKVHVNPSPDSNLKELGMGEWEGKTVQEIITQHKDADGTPLFLKCKDDPVNNPMPGGEKANEVDRRVMTSLQKIMESHLPAENIMIVTHACPIAVVLCHVLHQDLRELTKNLNTDNASVTVLEVGPDLDIDKAKLLVKNDTSHLQEYLSPYTS